MIIIKSIMYADFEKRRSRDRDLGTPELEKKLLFLSPKFINLLNVER